MGIRHLSVANFYLLPTRAWELGVGAIIAIAPGNGRLGDARAGQVASILGLGLVLYAVFAFDPMVPFPSFWTLVPVLGTGLLLAGAGPGNPVGRLLALPPLVGIGLISYSAYLWHQPLFVFARIRHIELEPWQYLARRPDAGLAWAAGCWSSGRFASAAVFPRGAYSSGPHGERSAAGRGRHDRGGQRLSRQSGRWPDARRVAGAGALNTA